MTVPAFQAATKVDSSGTVAFSGGGTVTGLYAVATTTAGSVTLREGDATGDVRFGADTPAADEGVWLPFPGRGVEFDDDVFVEFTNVTSVTVMREAS